MREDAPARDDAPERGLDGVSVDDVAARTGTHVDADVYPTLLAAVAGAAMRTALHRWLAGDFTVPLPRLVDEAWDALAAGLPAPRT